MVRVWKQITVSCIQNCFKKIGFSLNNLDNYREDERIDNELTR